MKKLLVCLAALVLTAVSSFAQEQTAYSIRLADTELYFSTIEVQNNAYTTYSLSNNPEYFYITETTGGYTIKSKSTSKNVGYTGATTWHFFNVADTWKISKVEDGATVTILKNNTQGFGVDKEIAGSGVFTDKQNNYWVLEKEGTTTGGGGPSPEPENYSPSASTTIFALSKLGDDILDLFYEAEQKGRAYPTEAEFAAYGVSKADLAFVRSHTRKRSIMVDHSKDVNPNVTENRQLFLNLPMGVGKSVGGYPSQNFGDDVFSMWNYTNLWGAWNHGLFSAPAGWVDCAHKNGTDMMTGIKFFESWGTTSGGWIGKVTALNEDGSYKYVNALINALLYFGHDGINYNFEDQGYTQKSVVGFHKALYKRAAEVGFKNFHIMMYTSQQSISDTYADAMWGKKATGRTTELMLNYNGGDFATKDQIQNAYQKAMQYLGTADGLYTGVWIAGMSKSWSNLDDSSYPNNKKVGVCLWGEHAQSRFYSYNTGDSPMDFENRYQKLLERGFSGGYRNPAMRPTPTNTGIEWVGTTPLSNFQGLAEYIPERTAIQGNLPFINYFNLGNGERYNYKGKKTLDSWYNMSAQDIVPTYRWLVTNINSTTGTNNVQPEFTHEDAYTGGSCIKLVGTATAGADITLWRTKLTATKGAVKGHVAVKTVKEGTNATNLSLIVRKFNNNTWYEYPVGSVTGADWKEIELPLTDIAEGDIIEYIGLRVRGAGNNLLVGKIAITDEIAPILPCDLTDVEVEVREELPNSLSAKLNWKVNHPGGERAAYDMLYNDEANIDHFELLYKNGVDGRISEVGRTLSWGGYIGGIKLQDEDEPYVGVRAASIDGKSYSDIVWVEVPRAKKEELPAAATSKYPTIDLSAEADGAATARKTRYLTTVKTTGAVTDLNYTCSKPAGNDQNYVFAQDHKLVVKQGTNVTLTFKGYRGEDDIRYCMGRAFMDFDHDYFFKGSGDERVYIDFDEFKMRTAAYPAYVGGDDGKGNGVTTTFHIPEDAVIGESRLRLVFSDAWFPHPGSAGLTQKGFAIDFPAEITGTNPERQAPADTHDQGIYDEPEGLIISGIHSAQSGELTKATLENGNLRFDNAEKIWVFNAQGQVMHYSDNNTTSISTQNYVPGAYFIRMQNGAIICTQKVMIK